MDVRDVLEPQVGDDARGQAETPALSNVPTIERVPPDGLDPVLVPGHATRHR